MPIYALNVLSAQLTRDLFATAKFLFQLDFTCCITLFTACVSAVGELIDSYGVSYHQFADDTQFLVSMGSTNATPTIDRLAHCSAAVRLWFLQNLTLTSQRWSFSVPLLSSGQLPTSPPSTLPEALCRSHRSSSRFVRLSREKRCKGLQLPHSSSAPRAQSTD